MVSGVSGEKINKFRIVILIFALPLQKTCIMKMKITSVLALLCMMAFVACSEKKQSTDIIATKPVAKAPAGPIKMSEYERTENVEWGGETYKVTVKRSVIADAPLFTDVNGKKYYENRLSLVVRRPDGSEFVNRDFTKQSFSDIVDADYLQKSTALGLAFLDIRAGKMVFLASVGCPDELSDDYVPISLTITRDGALSMKKSDDLGDVASGDEE